MLSVKKITPSNLLYEAGLRLLIVIIFMKQVSLLVIAVTFDLVKPALVEQLTLVGLFVTDNICFFDR